MRLHRWGAEPDPLRTAPRSASSAELIASAPQRGVWGSNWPHPHAPEPKPDEAALLSLLADWAPYAALHAAILMENPARLRVF